MLAYDANELIVAKHVEYMDSKIIDSRLLSRRGQHTIITDLATQLQESR